MSQPFYMKDVKKSTFAIEWIPFLITDVSTTLFGAFMVGLVFETLFSIERPSLFAYIPLAFLLSIFSCFEARRIYRVIKEKPFASIDDKRLVLYFGKDPFSWEQVKDVVVEGGRKVTITFTEDGKEKKKVNDLKWLTGRDDFIQSLERACNERTILYREREMTLSSRVGLILRMIKRSVLENSPERKQEALQVQI